MSRSLSSLRVSLLRLSHWEESAAVIENEKIKNSRGWPNLDFNFWRQENPPPSLSLGGFQFHRFCASQALPLRNVRGPSPIPPWQKKHVLSQHQTTPSPPLPPHLDISKEKTTLSSPPPLLPSSLPPQQCRCTLFHLPLPTLLATMRYGGAPVSPSSTPFSLSTHLPPFFFSSRHPTAKWAQRSDKVYLTIELPDAKDVKLKLEPEGKLAFSATKDGVPYGIDIELIDKVNVEESKVSVGLRSIVCVIQKSEKKWWSRLLKQGGRPPAFLKVDWDKWVDEEEEDKKGLDLDDMDFSIISMAITAKGKRERRLWRRFIMKLALEKVSPPLYGAMGSGDLLPRAGSMHRTPERASDNDRDGLNIGERRRRRTRTGRRRRSAETSPVREGARERTAGSRAKLDMGGDDDLDMDDFKDGDEEEVGTQGGEESKGEAESASEAVGETKLQQERWETAGQELSGDASYCGSTCCRVQRKNLGVGKGGEGREGGSGRRRGRRRAQARVTATESRLGS
ncbi:hypothetical protein Taro_026575 [Colocasia esculenta]|uniref:Co-chaperone protein p23 n=1 Tax=Colocasia esculenta TaxID=4460 RepID=A0A843VL03_COLES|nr:hypothetical protein [Colocasia esculenta]